MTASTPLKFLVPGWFSIVMGTSGLALAWLRAVPVMGEPARSVAWVIGWLAALVFALLLGASALRARRYPQALADDLKHPLRHAFVAAVPVSLLLLAALGVSLSGSATAATPLWRALWWLGSLAQLWATLWVLGRWLAPAPASQGTGGPVLWPGITPVLLIPVVGNVVAPLGGVLLEIEGWSTAQLAIGTLLWPVVVTLVLVRRMVHSPLPEPLQPSWFILLAPPSLIGLSLVLLQAPLPLVQGFWGIAFFMALLLVPVARRVSAQPFGLPFWAASFPLAAFTSLTLRLAELQPESRWYGPLQSAGLLLLAFTTLVVLWLAFATVRGLRDGSLLSAEPIAAAPPPSAAGAAG
jgi:tellurite resistance protein